MYDLILQLSVFLSLGAIIYLISRALPRVNDAEPPAKQPFSFFTWAFANLPFEKMDIMSAGFLEKILRRFRVGILKVDNWLNFKINRVKEINGNGKNNSINKPNLFKIEDAESKEKEV